VYLQLSADCAFAGKELPSSDARTSKVVSVFFIICLFDRLDMDGHVRAFSEMPLEGFFDVRGSGMGIKQ